MKKVMISIFTLVVFAGIAAAQNMDSQTSASGSQNTSVSADKSGAQVQSDSSAQASQNASVSKSNKSKKASANADANANSSASASTSGNQLAEGSTVNAVLSKSLDARNLKEGDQIVAKATQNVKSEGKTIIPKGSKLIGHVTEAKSRAKGDADSALGVVFDRAELKNGQQVPMHAVVQALASAQSAASAGVGDDSAMLSGAGSGSGMVSGSAPAPSSGGLVHGVGQTVGSTVGGVTSTANTAVNTTGNAVGNTTGKVGSAANSAGGSVTGNLTSNSQGVIGLNGLNLTSAASNMTQGSLITSSGKDVKLDSGTQMLLKVVNK